MDTLLWFKIQIIYPLNSSLDESEISEVEAIRLRNEGLLDDYETDIGVFNLANDPITHITPKAFIPKGKTNKKYYSEIVFESGNVVLALGKPESVYDKILEYHRSLPALESPA